jgi:hypothetical protein
VVDPVDLLLFEEACQQVVEFLGRGGVLAERLLHQHPSEPRVLVAAAGKPACRQPLEDHAVVLGRHGQVEEPVGTDAPLLLDDGEVERERLVRVRVVEVPALIAEHLEEPLALFTCGRREPLVALQDAAHVCAKVVVRPIAP